MIVEKPFGAISHPRMKLNRDFARNVQRARRSFASTTTSARRPSTTWCTSALPTPFSNRFGIATISRACRSRWPRISASEAGGAFYEETGAIRDVVQNHLFQVLPELAMEPPVRTDSESLRDEKVKVLRASPDSMRIMLSAGSSAVTSTKRAWPRTRVETFAAMQLKINSWRWQGVPF